MKRSRSAKAPSEKKARNDKAESLQLTNEQASLIALLGLAGELDAVDTEDVALAADQIAPGRFRWRKYKQHIDLGLVRNGLQDAKKDDLVSGGALKGWKLTEAGAAQARELADAHNLKSVRRRETPADRARRAAEAKRLRGEDAYRQWKSGDAGHIAVRDIHRFFRIDEYVVGAARLERVRKLALLFEGDAELSMAIKTLAEKLSQ